MERTFQRSVHRRVREGHVANAVGVRVGRHGADGQARGVSQRVVVCVDVA